MANKNSVRHAVDSLSGSAPSPRFRINPEQTSGKKPLPNVKSKSLTPKKNSGEFTFELKIPKFTMPKLPYRRLAKTAAIIAIGLLIVAGAASGLKHVGNSPEGSQETLKTAPAFDTLEPEKEQTAGRQLNYDPQKQVASFGDTVGGTVVTVSQQPLPDNFKGQPAEEVEKLAKNFNATKVTNVGDIKAYSGVSSEDGSQTIIFTKKDLLVFIRAKSELTQDELARYITDLG